MTKTTKLIGFLLAVLVALSLAMTASAANLTQQQAKQIALEHAGLTEAEITSYRIVTDYDDGQQIYEIEFSKGLTEYEIEISVSTGKILSYDVENETPRIPPVITPTVPSQTGITAEQAKQTALAHAGFIESEVSAMRVRKDTENSRVVYEIEFFVGNTEYDYDIDFLSGAIISFDSDTETPKNPTPAVPTGAPVLTIEQAKAIALEKAGVTEADVTYIKTELSFDDGQAEYEIDFRVGYKADFEIEINAQTGEITDFDRDGYVTTENLSANEKINAFFAMISIFFSYFLAR